MRTQTLTQPHGFGLLYVQIYLTTQTNTGIKTYILYDTTNTRTDSHTITQVRHAHKMKPQLIREISEITTLACFSRNSGILAD